MAEVVPLRVSSAADQWLAAGETMDVLVTPTRAGTLVLEVTSAGPLVTTRVPVRVHPRYKRWKASPTGRNRLL